MIAPLAEDAIHQIEYVRNECTDLLASLRKFCPGDEDGSFPDTFRLLATPMFYSIWERCFSSCNAVTLRLLRDQTIKAADLTPHQRAAWLLRTPFYQSFCAQLRNNNLVTESPREVKKGQFASTAEFLRNLETWSGTPIDPATEADEIVMTFSNVNPDVVAINAQAIGIDSYEAFNKLKFGRLHDLVGIRNSIGHGAIVSPPSSNQFSELWAFTESLVNNYCTVFISWIKDQIETSNATN